MNSFDAQEKTDKLKQFSRIECPIDIDSDPESAFPDSSKNGDFQSDRYTRQGSVQKLGDRGLVSGKTKRTVDVDSAQLEAHSKTQKETCKHVEKQRRTGIVEGPLTEDARKSLDNALETCLNDSPLTDDALVIDRNNVENDMSAVGTRYNGVNQRDKSAAVNAYKNKRSISLDQSNSFSSVHSEPTAKNSNSVFLESLKSKYGDSPRSRRFYSSSASVDVPSPGSQQSQPPRRQRSQSTVANLSIDRKDSLTDYLPKSSYLRKRLEEENLLGNSEQLRKNSTAESHAEVRRSNSSGNERLYSVSNGTNMSQSRLSSSPFGSVIKVSSSKLPSSQELRSSTPKPESLTNGNHESPPFGKICKLYHYISINYFVPQT